ncbi:MULTISPECIES: FRG domain-containing protein [Streptococcus]|jgi:FRG domain protein|uniref:FRG domain-containing protein n=1 Tax=Streptococcus TaxID=1301 RepID=UPI000F5FD5A6|nr:MULTISPECIES: FRG domain-containing protein [Streptococcus]RRD32807.1 FRG domain-containing protein [Streptococcus sp. OH4692_COT-348]
MEYTKEINSLKDYIDFIIGYRLDSNTECWYRGHRDDSWSLRPNIFRNQILDMPADNKVHSIRYKNFINFQDEIIEFRNQLKHKKKYNSDFNLFHYTFIGQHYGLKTPALDWSTDPLVALYFALDKYEYIEDGPFPVVYILNPSILNKYAGLVISNEDEYSDIIEPLIVDELDDEDFMKLFKDLNNTPFSPTPLAVKSNLDLNCHRISRQSGVFTLHEARHLKSPEWFARSTDFGMVLKINPQKAVEIRKHLNLLNINEETIYGIGVDSKELSQIAEKIVNKTDII